MINSLNHSIVMGGQTFQNLATEVWLDVSFDNFTTRTYYHLWLHNWGGGLSITSLTYNLNEEIFAGLGGGKIRKIIGVTLPVELISFNAEVNNNNIRLKWKTATELNTMDLRFRKASIMKSISLLAS